MPIPTYGQVTVDKDTWDRLNARIARIAQLESALIEIRDKAATMENGGAWAAGLATMSLHTVPMAVDHK